MTKEYVVACCPRNHHGEKELLIIYKARPAWQRNRINLPGGKMEDCDGGDPIKAALRELMEETGFDTDENLCSVVGKIVDRVADLVVHVVSVPLIRPKTDPREGETERFAWRRWRHLRSNRRLIPNLRVIIPLVLNGVSGWCISDPEPSFGKPEHTFTVTVPTYDKGI